MTRLLAFLFLLSLLASCSIEKRLYRPGFHFERAGKISAANETPRQEKQNGQEPFVAAGLPDTVAALPVTSTFAEEKTGTTEAPRAAPVSRRVIHSAQKEIRAQAQQVIDRTDAKFQSRRQRSRVPEPIREAFWAGLLITFLAGPISAAVIFAPEAFLSGGAGGEDIFWLLTTPIISVAFIFFAPGLIRDCARAMGRVRETGKDGPFVMGMFGILFCVIGSLLSVATFVGLLLNPVVLLIVALACLLCLLYLVLS